MFLLKQIYRKQQAVEALKIRLSAINESLPGLPLMLDHPRPAPRRSCKVVNVKTVVVVVVIVVVVVVVVVVVEVEVVVVVSEEVVTVVILFVVVVVIIVLVVVLLAADAADMFKV
ncbi:hypothetical protein DPMN_131775 [Dreissena polymorpha]|uniref:Uncharacterized protein n=1 Tax=Dreissena polymorpha TaxID=45954 RepID=A0A9D4FR75_DREPO|nr:hypothetical protein DPMN_131775 [Dreissena polymorpha]